MKKKVILISVILVILGAVAGVLIYKSKNVPKGPRNNLNVGSDSTRIKYNGKEIEITGSDRDKFIANLARMGGTGVENITNDSDINYDIEIDFMNGYSALISTDDCVYRINDKETGQPVIYSAKKKYIKKTVRFLKKEMK
ncbi:MAG: hypothetical protein PUA49_08960 [Butyrivibrio sp.]|nr:hypothetical protein [Butyrivibrio sp.]